MRKTQSNLKQFKTFSNLKQFKNIRSARVLSDLKILGFASYLYIW